MTEPTLEQLAEASRRFEAGWTYNPTQGWKRPPGASSKHLTLKELRAVARIWPGAQLEFNLERHSG